MDYCVAQGFSFVSRIDCKEDGMGFLSQGCVDIKFRGSWWHVEQTKKANVANTFFMSETKISYRRVSLSESGRGC